MSMPWTSARSLSRHAHAKNPQPRIFQQIADGQGQLAEAVFEIPVQAVDFRLVARGRNLLVDPQPRQFLIDEVRRDFQIDFQIDGGFDLRQHFTGPQLFDRPFEQLAIQIEADRLDVSMLLAAQQVARAAQLQIERRDPEPGAQFAEFAYRGQPAAGNLASASHQTESADRRKHGDWTGQRGRATDKAETSP